MTNKLSRRSVMAGSAVTAAVAVIPTAVLCKETKPAKVAIRVNDPCGDAEWEDAFSDAMIELSKEMDKRGKRKSRDGSIKMGFERYLIATDTTEYA
jgi:hypothetical protein